jgi:diguanylate cyclase (GGDEF)-like protein
MTSERLIFVVILITAAVIVLMLSVYAWGKRITAGRSALYLSICMAAVSIYTFCYAMEVASNTLPQIMFWVRFEHFGIQIVAPTWLLFSLCLAGKERLITPRRIVMLFIFPVAFIAITQTLGTLNLGHPNPRLDTSGPFPIFTYDRGEFSYISLIFESLCLAVATVLYTMMLIRAAPTFRRQAILLWIGSLIPWCTAILYNLGLTPYYLDPSPLALSLSGMVFALGFFRFHLLDIVPLARDVIFEGMDNGVLVLDTNDRIIDFNPRLSAMLPTVSKAVVGLTAFEALAAYPALLDLLKDSPPEATGIVVVDGESQHYYRASLIPLQDWRKQAKGKIITLNNYTPIKKLLDQMEILATRDSLTGVYNRRYFIELAAKEVYRSQRYGTAFSLIMFDIDRFKDVNDTYGHAAGDMALQAVAETCIGTLRQSDIIGRYGGEEFIILLPETDPPVATALAQRLRLALEQQQMQYEGHIIQVKASFGVTGVVPSTTAVLDDLLRCVDQALYEAKETGRNRVCVCLPSQVQPQY